MWAMTILIPNPNLRRWNTVPSFPTDSAPFRMQECFVSLSLTGITKSTVIQASRWWRQSRFTMKWAKQFFITVHRSFPKHFERTPYVSKAKCQNHMNCRKLSGSTSLRQINLESNYEQWVSHFHWHIPRLDEYIAHYHPAFENDGKDLDAWKHYKKTLNNRYRNISIKISNLEVNVEDSKARAYFRQRYRSDSYQDDEYKLIEFRKEGHSWKIFRERSFAKEPDKWPKYAKYIKNGNIE